MSKRYFPKKGFEPPARATDLKVGDRVLFQSERNGYTVRAVDPDARFAVLTKPFNLYPSAPPIYTIIDFSRGVRGPDDRLLCEGYETEQHISDRLEQLRLGTIEVSYRRSITLDVREVRSG